LEQRWNVVPKAETSQKLLQQLNLKICSAWLVRVVAERIVMGVQPNLGVCDHTMAAMLDGARHHLDILRPISSGVFMFNTLRWSFWFCVP
jgi:hypothetical protein